MQNIQLNLLHIVHSSIVQIKDLWRLITQLQIRTLISDVYLVDSIKLLLIWLLKIILVGDQLAAKTHDVMVVQMCPFKGIHQLMINHNTTNKFNYLSEPNV